MVFDTHALLSSQVIAKITNYNCNSMKQTKQIEKGILLAQILRCANLKLRE